MNNQDNQSDLQNPQTTDIWQKFKNKKFIFITLGVILIVFLVIITFIPEKHLEKKITPTPPAPTPTIRAPRVEDQVILKFKKGVTDREINERLKQYSATIIKRVDELNLILVEVPKGQGDAMLDAFKKDNLVEKAQPNYIYKSSTNDPSYNLQWGLKNTGQNIQNQAGTPNADINVEPAWTVTKGNGVKIAIIDSGIDLNHPDLSSKIVAQKDFTGEGIDDQFGHGTHVAGIVAAVTDNATGIAGTCPQCQLIIVKVIYNTGQGTSFSITSGISWAVNQGAKVINMSFANTAIDPAIQQMVSDAWTKGVVLVAAASNADNDPTLTNPAYPAAYPNVVSVAATDNNDYLASFSHYGTWVSVAAPGLSIYSTLPTHSYSLQTTGHTALNYDYLSGTSMASPMVSGVVGLIWASSYGTSNDAVVKRLCDTADKITGTGTYWTCGRINAGNAVVSTSATTPAPTPALISSGTPPWGTIGDCINNNNCPTITPTPASMTSMPNQSPALSAPVTSSQPTSIQPSIHSVIVPIGNMPGNSHDVEFIKLIFFIILFILKLLGIG
jgi:thermitase